MDLKKKFNEALANYKINVKSQRILEKTPLVLLVGMSGSGRDTLVRELLGRGGYYGVITHTTRPPRVNEGIKEVDGEDYFFRSETEILEMIKLGELVAVGLVHHQQVSGVSIKEIEKASNLDKVALTDIEVAGAEEFMRIKPDTICIFTLPPNVEVWLDRLKKRGKLEPQEFTRRLVSAQKELVKALNSPYYHYVINDDLAEAVREIDDLAHKRGTHKELDTQGRALAVELLKGVQELFKSQ